MVSPPSAPAPTPASTFPAVGAYALASAAGGAATESARLTSRPRRRTPALSDARRAELCGTVRRRTEPVDEALAPARPARRPAELPARLGVRGAADLGHEHDGRLARREPGQPPRDMPGRRSADGGGEMGQPLPHGSGVVVDDVVDPRRAVLERGDGRRGRVVEVDEGPYAAAVADHGKAARAQQLGLLAALGEPGPRPVEPAVAQDDALEVARPGHGL